LGRRLDFCKSQWSLGMAPITPTLRIAEDHISSADSSMKFFKRELLGKHGVTGWRVDRWQSALDRYNKHFDAIRSRLPIEVVQFHELSLHDLVVDEIEWVAPEQLRLRIGSYQVVFIDVRSSNLPAGLVGTEWLYSEVHLARPRGFELHVLLDGDQEMSVCAEGLSVYDTLKRTWIIGKELDYTV
jgi:hypothetical protein